MLFLTDSPPSMTFDDIPSLSFHAFPQHLPYPELTLAPRRIMEMNNGNIRNYTKLPVPSTARYILVALQRIWRRAHTSTCAACLCRSPEMYIPNVLQHTMFLQLLRTSGPRAPFVDTICKKHLMVLTDVTVNRSRAHVGQVSATSIETANTMSRRDLSVDP